MKYNDELMENLKNNEKFDYQDLDNTAEFSIYHAKKSIINTLDETENLIKEIKNSRKQN